ncbi:MAG: GNAT family N-acetyltransferase [Clostridiales bacterium]|nr:GNAT family N-acetyltransferase [Clostridiales bacterium]
MVQGKWFPMGSDISEAVFVREAVFGTGADELDAAAQQVVVYREGRPVGAARLWWADGAFRLGMLGVLPQERGKGYGDLLIRLLLFKALTHNAPVIALETPAETMPFFAKYGFLDGGAQENLHQMHILGENVQLSHCGGNCAQCTNRSEECVPKALR